MVAAILGGLMALPVLVAEGQEAVVEGRKEGLACSDGRMAVGDLGYSGLECNCTHLIGLDPSNRLWVFRSEPKVLGVDKDGPAAGQLRAGDVITAVDGSLITTKEGGRKFANLVPGTPTRIGVRRNGREMELMITPRLDCERIEVVGPIADVAPEPAPPKAPRPEAAPAPEVMVDAVPLVDAVPEIAAVPAPPAPPKASPSGRLGFSVSCTNCEVHIPDPGGVPRWIFSANPEVERVESGGPAERAGLRAGDVLTHIDGVPLTSETGGQRFGAVEPGDTVTFRFERNTRQGTARVVAERRRWIERVAPDARPPAVARVEVPRADVAEPTRFSGTIGTSHVVVSGGPITVTRTDKEIVIRSQDITVRIKSIGGDPQPK
jgi:membrane-associated protease RseP (regulator of RpoE activity)